VRSVDTKAKLNPDASGAVRAAMLVVAGLCTVDKYKVEAFAGVKWRKRRR